MPRVAEPIKISLEQYLELEEKSDVRHEFVDGQMFAMAGASINHNLISGNIYALARAAGRALGCIAFMADVKVITPNGISYYPDVFSSCDDTQSKYVKNNPCFIVEVFSPSTKLTDRREKLQAYQTIETLQGYLMVDHEEKIVEYLERTVDGWKLLW